MNKKQRNLSIETAMQQIASKFYYYSCVALEDEDDKLVKSYAKFYNKKYYDIWNLFEAGSKEGINQRLLLLALFKEVGLEGIGVE